MDGAQQVLESQKLPSDLAACHSLIRQLLEQLDNSSRKLTQMEYQLQQLLRRMYGRSSEKIDPKQLALFAEMLKQIESQNPLPEPTPEATAPAAENRKGHGRRKLAPDLPAATAFPRLRTLWDADARLRLLDQFGDYQQVLSLANPPLELLGPPQQTAELARMANDGLAELCRLHPERFPTFIASLPMNNIDAALQEIDRAVK